MKAALHKIGLGTFFFCWVIVAQAQQIITPNFGQFGHQLSLIPWQAWLWVFAFILVGNLARLQEAVKSRELEVRVKDMILWSFVGMVAGFITFGICEALNDVTGRRMPDLLQGALISAGAYNRKNVIDWISDRLRGMVKGSPAEGA